MSNETQPIFIVSSGRSGTQMCHKLLSTFPGVEAHHEYLCTHVQPIAVLNYAGHISDEAAKQQLDQLHGAAILYSDADVWVDSSNKLSWLIGPLIDLFPNARFVHLVRDGRKVASSFFHKLTDEIYDDWSVEILRRYLADPERNPCPPPEKRYWWTRPAPGHALERRFLHFNQFQRICFHWFEVNRVILRDLERVPAEQQLVVKLEELVSMHEEAERFLAFCGQKCTDFHCEMLRRPHNVNRPQDHALNPKQRDQFWEIAGDMMRHFGYDLKHEYAVAY